MPARVHSTDPQYDAERGCFPVWDASADDRRRHDEVERHTPESPLAQFIIDFLEDNPQPAVEIRKAAAAAGFSEPENGSGGRTSTMLLRLRKDGFVKSERDVLHRKSPRARPAFCPLWELT